MYPRQLTRSRWLVLAVVLWAASSCGCVALAPQYETLANVEYKKVDGKSLALDLYFDPGTTWRKPLVIYIHGGGWSGRTKSDGLWYANAFVKRGYVFASIDYRLSTVAVFPAQIEDAKAAVRFLRAHASDYRIDPDRIGVIGHSAGGHLSALLGTTNGDLPFHVGDNLNVSDAVQAVCDMSGPIDFNAPAPDLTSMLKMLLGGPLSEKADLAKQASPIDRITSSAPPFLILHGAKDPVVPPAESQDFAAALQKAGVPVQLILLPDQGHNINIWAHVNQGNYLDLILKFFDATLKKSPSR